MTDLREFLPRLLVVDIETMANLCWSWGTWQQNIAPSQIVKHKRTICFAAKWVGEKKVRFFSEYHNGHDAMVRNAWELLDEADAVIGYNSKRFDVKHLNTEFDLAGLGAPSHFQHIDLYQVAKKEFAHGSNKLDSILDRKGMDRKLEHEGFGLWLKCEAGDPKAWRQMKAYNTGDVRRTEELFEEWRNAGWLLSRGISSSVKVRDLLNRYTETA